MPRCASHTNNDRLNYLHDQLFQRRFRTNIIQNNRAVISGADKYVVFDAVKTDVIDSLRAPRERVNGFGSGVEFRTIRTRDRASVPSVVPQVDLCTRRRKQCDFAMMINGSDNAAEILA